MISFLGRGAALVSAVVVNPAGGANPALCVKDVEVWTSTASGADGFAKVAAASLEPKKAEQAITFTPVEARFVKVRFITSGDQLGLLHASAL